jgi:predicted acylesterase/phospholipase RssA
VFQSSHGISTLPTYPSSLGVGYSGSGWLILFFTGVTAVLKELGIISNTTRLAGSSGGSANAAATCAGIHPVQQYHSLKDMADYCRCVST